MNLWQQHYNTYIQNINLKTWKFQVGRNYWDSEVNTRKFLDSVSKEFKINDMEDWYAISQRNFIQKKGKSLIRRYGGLIPILSKYYPEYNWLSYKFRIVPSKSQVYLFKMIQSLFPQHEVLIEAKIPQLVYLPTKRELTLDIFIPTLQLAFEFQGFQHYTRHYLFGDHNIQQQRDKEKKEFAYKQG